MARIAQPLGARLPRPAFDRRPLFAMLLGAVAVLAAAVTPSRAEIFGGLTRGAADACRVAIDRTEQRQNIPRQLLTAISFVESGRSDPQTGEKIAWPWTVNNAGDGRYYDTKAQAIAAVKALWARGQRNIDVGCMQVNLMYHPEAFVDLEEAFDPEANVAYAASFLRQLREDSRSWSLAIANYHSATPERGQIYRKKVFDAWTQARLGHDRQQRAAVVAEYEALRSARAAQASASAAPSRPGVTVLRPREAQERVAWSAGALGTAARSPQRILSTNNAPRKLGWYRSAAGLPEAEPVKLD